MVLESVVADLLNRFLGDYVENLNKSQLKLGIWGGNVALDNLQIKENALSELDVPFRVKAGRIDKLTLKIPWKNLYGEAVVATLEGLYLLVVPGASIKYDAEKEEKYLQDNKQKELSRIEEALQKASEKGAHSGFIYGLENIVYKDTKPGRKSKKTKKHFKKPFKGHDRAKDKPKEEKKDTFLEKLATQVIKNVQVKITGIHIKYEDDITDPSRPLSLGMTLGELSLLTANENWTPCILNEAAKIIYKLLRLDSLSVYWNVDSEMYYHTSREQILERLKGGVPSTSRKPPDYQYIFRPVSASAKLYINPHAEMELKTPKIDWSMEVQSIAVELTKPQYLSMLDLLESIDYMVRNVPYRKYRPDVPPHKHARQWWEYATNGILEVHVRRYARMWSWSNIKRHRQLLRSYKNVYKNKLTQTKVSEETQKQMQDLEKDLDVFNIVLARQQAQVEVIRSGQKLLRKKSMDGEKKSGGWFSGLWGKKEQKKKEDEEELSVPETIDDLMTPEEKTKLFTAIGYSDSSHNLTLPKKYVAHVVSLKLLSTSFTIKEDQNVPDTLKIQIIDLSTKISQRPGAQALKVEAKLEHWYVTGLKQQNIVPSLVASIRDTSSSLLKLEFETNPEDCTADQSFTVESQPVEIIYDAKTINAMVEFFHTNKGMDLERLTTATLSKIEEIKERTATGLAHIIETRKVLNLRINLKPSYLLVPRMGFHYEKSDLLILDFGTFQLNSVYQGNHNTSSTSLEEIMDKAYDKFDVEIKNVQLLFGRSGENWKKARFEHPSALHILQPMDIHVQLAKSMVEKDIRMARFKVSGELPLVHLRASDLKIKGVFELLDSIPLPQKSTVSASSVKAPAIPIIADARKGFLSAPLLLEGVESESEEEYFDADDCPKPVGKTSPRKREQKTEVGTVQEELTDLQLKFEIREVILELTKQLQREETVLIFNVKQLGTEATVRTFDLRAVSYLRKISLDYYEIQGKRQQLHLISSSDKPGLDLLKVEYTKADKNGPKFQTVFENTKQTVQVAFSSLNLLLHTQALLSTINFLMAVIPSRDLSAADKGSSQIQQEKQTSLKKVVKTGRDKDVFDFRLFAKLDAFCLNVCDENSIAEIKIQGLDSSLFLQSSQTTLFARLKDIIVADVDPGTIHKKAVSIVGDEVFSFNLVLYPDATEGEAYTDMSNVDGIVTLKVGCIQIVYLHKFLMSLLNFLNNFQMAKEAVSAATVQAAEKAATSVRDLAQRSFRLSMDIHLKAPVILIPQSSVSYNAVVIDLGLIRIQNQFSLVLTEDCPLPPVMDKLDVQLTQLKMLRTVLQPGFSQTDIQILHPINLNLSVNRNLAGMWYHKIPLVEIKGHLDTMNIILRPEDLNVLLKVLTENLAEADNMSVAKPMAPDEGNIKEIPLSRGAQKERPLDDDSSSIPNEALQEDMTNLLLNFEIKEVVVTLMKQVEKRSCPLHILTVLQLGTEGRIKTHEMTATAYLKKIQMKCLEFTDSRGDPLNIISSSDESGEHLLKIEYIKADAEGPHFETIYNSTKQALNVSFSSLDLLLYTEALLSIMNFFTYSSASRGLAAAEKGADVKQPSEESKAAVEKPVPSSGAHDNVCDLKLTAKLKAFNILLCDQKCNIADIRIQGMEASVFATTEQTEVFARLQDFVITNVDPKTVHKKTVSIVGGEVFRFMMSLYPEVTEGEAYMDMSKVDGKMSLKVGCIQIVYLHKFFMSLLNFLNRFQTAKDALSAATAQAAERAASSMKDFAKKSFRLSMDINLKAPVIVIPQSSVSHNVLVADLGLIRVQNAFSLVPGEEASPPPVIDQMDVQLTHLKISRTMIANGSQPDIEIVQPVNLLLSIQRNLAAAWYPQIPGIAIKGDLKAMQVALSQDDLTLLLNILLENLGEAAVQPEVMPPTLPEVQMVKQGKIQTDAGLPEDVLITSGQVDLPESQPESVTLTFHFHFESLSVVLYNTDVDKRSQLSLHNNSLRLGELRLHLMTSSGKMFSNGSMDINTNLKTCTLDDLREGIQKATSRMIDKKDDQSDNVMIDINYNQNKNGSEIVAILDKLYLCASVEFLLTVADFFIKSMPTASMERPTQIQLKHTAPGKPKPEKDGSLQPNMMMLARIMDPEIVFVASLTKADAPALAVTFQCDCSMSTGPLAQQMTAQVHHLRVLACPFLRKKGDKNVTTVVQPCSLHMEAMMCTSGEQNVSVMVEEFIVKISPIILNTVITIMAAMKPKPKEEELGGTACDAVNLWDVQPIDQCHSWFLGVDMATEATETFLSSEQCEKKESFRAEVKSVQITLECGLGHSTIPLLLAESTFSGTVKNWSSLMAARADMTLEVHYYNESYAVWEPLIERTDKEGRQWKLKLEMKTNPAQEKGLLPGDDFIVLPEPQSVINISSRDTMNITISKCSLAVFSNLAKGFSEGAASTYDSLKDRAPFTVKNALGIPLKVHASQNLQVVGLATSEDIHDIGIDQNMELEYFALESTHQGKLSVLHRQESCMFTLSLAPQGYTEVAGIPIAKPGRRLHNVRDPRFDHSDSVLVQIDAIEGNKVITIRSPLQIKNHFSVPFIVYKFVRNVKMLEQIGVSKPEEEFHVPLDSYRCQLFLQPTGILEGQYKVSTTYITWREELHRSSEVRCMLQCPSAEVNFLPLIVNAAAVPDELNFIATHGEDWDPAYVIHLYPALTMRNLLPYSLRYLLEGTAEAHELPEGSTADVLHSRISGEIMELVLIKYQGKNWNGHLRINDALPEFFPVCFTSNSADVMTVDLYIHVRKVGSRLVLSVYSPYWIINKTSRVLQYRAEDVHVKHAADYRDIVLFSFKKKNIFSKNKIQLSISTSTWSSSFSLDTVGSYGCVKCPAHSMDYLVGVSIKMSSFNLTRIVTLTPFYTIANKSSLELEVGEMGPDGSLPTNKWSYFSSSECLPFWPENVSGKLCIRVIGGEALSKPFFFSRQDNGTLLSLEELNTGILVDVNVSDHSTVISFSDYHEGAAPALIVNHTPWETLRYQQSGVQEQRELKPREVRLFAWADPTGVKKLVWAYAQNTGELDLLKDECGQFPYNSNTQIHWVSFLDGRQRVLLFTDDVGLVSKARQAEEMEQPDQEINVSLHSLGLSLVNNDSKQEISYIGITSSGVVWEFKPKQKWKPFNQKQIGLLEQMYQKWHSAGNAKALSWVKIDSNFEVNFSKMPMEMRLPIKCNIKRDFLSGIQIEFKQSPHQKSLRAQLYWLQVDNQLPGSVFPVVFHPVAPPKSIALDSEPKPFIDVSIIIRFNEYSKVLQFKYFMVLIQEMALKIDQGFLGAVFGLLTPSTDPEAEKQRTKLIQKDVDALNTQLMESSLSDMSALSFFEHFHISPLKLHLSLSLGSGGEASDKGRGEMIAIHSVNLLLKSIGATLTDVDDLIFKLAFFEIRYQFYKRDQLMWRVFGHYRDQFLKQMYVLVLGLDVLGNPFGLIRGLSEGVEAFFYEPFQGAVQGPEEFAEGFVIGVKSLLGHTVGGAAGVVSRITGSVGKGLAAITMDKEYQQKRREEMGRQPKDFGDSLAKGGKGFLRGVVGGVTGIITKPVEGAKKEGAAGFFKGIGKGLVGVVARPTGGIVDMASSTFQGIQRVAESTEEVSNLRPPRLIHEDGIIRPYDRGEAEGYDLFENSHIKKLAGETFRFHCAVPGGKKAHLVITNRRVMVIKEVEILGHLTTDWDCLYEDFTRPPAVHGNELQIFVKDQGLLVFHKKGSPGQELSRKIQLKDTTSAKRIGRAIEEAQATRHQQKLVKQASLKLSSPQTSS
ncbi:intermembrane lipid transfer protein VPS13C isoform X2 [Hemicordylus capensis]|uniref:intermembrane lipid transfer protein VPS13C isoform X2 n=1 Tax=Hemicordylus capensis TaxID=884348 RepID=UPI002303BA8A|nr:intermembrane lipid transfer protein VPS13C isoform X2 [Hemicordylus capensis]